MAEILYLKNLVLVPSLPRALALTWLAVSLVLSADRQCDRAESAGDSWSVRRRHEHLWSRLRLSLRQKEQQRVDHGLGKS